MQSSMLLDALQYTILIPEIVLEIGVSTSLYFSPMSQERCCQESILRGKNYLPRERDIHSRRILSIVNKE